MPEILAIASTVLLLGVATFLYLFALTFGSLLGAKPEAFVEDETADVLESHPGWREAGDGDTPGQLEPQLDGPTSRPYIPLSSRHVWPQPPAEVFDQPDDVWEIHASEPKPKLHRLCVEAYADRRYSDICKTCTPRMGVRP